MRVLKVVLEGITTSFRYPHFMLSVQPGFPMPPPATIYGHICSTLGEWVDPTGIQFAYHFTSEGGATDLEHIHVLSAAGGKLEGTRLPKVMEGNVNPFTREILFRPRLILYLNRPEWAEAFRSPRYPVVLGRSQDLCCYTSISEVQLEHTDGAYFEHTLMPYAMAASTAAGTVALLPRWLDYQQSRRPSFARYVLLQQRIKSTDREFLRFGDNHTRFWCDPTVPQSHGLPLGLFFHSFVGGDDEALTLA